MLLHYRENVGKSDLVKKVLRLYHWYYVNVSLMGDKNILKYIYDEINYCISQWIIMPGILKTLKDLKMERRLVMPCHCEIKC